MVYREEEEGLQQLRLDGRSSYDHDGLAREHGRPLRHGPDVARELEVAQVVEEGLREHAPAAQIGDILLGKVQVPDIVHGLLEPCRYGKAAAVRNIAEEDVKIADLVRLPVHKVAVAHGQLVKIAEHGQIEFFIRFHTAPLMHMLLPRL